MSGAARAGKVTSNAVQIGTEPSKAARRVILGLVGGLFAIPIVAMILFTLKNSVGGGYTFSHWTGLFDPAQSGKYQQLFIAVGNSLQLAVVTVAIILVILVPTMILVHLQFPKLRRVLEFICIVPVTVPAIVLVVGLAPVYAVVVRIFGGSIWTLAFAYGVTVLPYAYRAIQANLSAVDVITLSEAARSLGAGWGNVMWRILLPNLRRGILAASFITVAVVLGEFTIASLLGRNNLQTALVQVSKVDPFVAVIFALIALFFAFVLLLLIGRLGSAGRNRKAL
ncbi:MAG: transporter permease subunit [Microbacteriaceae bacterium]|nr:transporter permease subunit [Microbacteriaceae bacterium]